jgi:glutathione synthase/RimK-type ligase-like ATP-grasp enzyme
MPGTDRQTVQVTRRIAVATWSNPDYRDPEARLVADELGRRGHDAVVVPWDSGLDWTAFDLVAIRSTWDYFERLGEFLDWAELVDAASSIVNPLNVIRWNCHKGYLGELAAAGVPVLPSLAVPQGAHDAAERLAASGWDDVVLKPAVDGGARLALKTRASAPEAAAHLARLVGAGDAIVQPYAPSVELGETSLFFFGGEYSHAVRKVPRSGDYRVQALHGGSEERHDATVAELEVAAAAMALAPGQLTYARADFIDVEGGPTLMELELIEPDLFLRMSPDALHHYADALEAALP